MLSHNLEQSLHRALAFANERRHEFATLEHLLLALAEDQDAVAVMRACGVKVDKLRQELVRYLDRELAGLVQLGLLRRVGLGRATRYVPPMSDAAMGERVV